jgi:hypothetical protein
VLWIRSPNGVFAMVTMRISIPNRILNSIFGSFFERSEI